MLGSMITAANRNLSRQFVIPGLNEPYHPPRKYTSQHTDYRPAPRPGPVEGAGWDGRISEGDPDFYLSRKP